MKTQLSVLIFAATLSACATTAPTDDISPECADDFGLAYDVMADFRAALPEDQGDIKLTEYCIIGSAPEDLLTAMQTQGPSENPAGGTFFARTDWSVDWQYDYKIVENVCHARDIQTRLTVHYQMPKWRYDDDSKDPGLVAFWTHYIARLAVHEIGHGDVGQNKRESIQAALMGFESEEASCNALGSKLNALASSVINDINLDEIYDKATGHGKTQGAFFSLTDAKAAMEAAG